MYLTRSTRRSAVASAKRAESAGRLAAMSAARSTNERRPARAGSFAAMIIEAIIVIPLGVPAVRKAIRDSEVDLNGVGLDWLPGSIAAPAWTTSGSALYASGTIITALLLIIGVGLFTYLSLHATRPVSLASFVPVWGSITLMSVLVGLLRGVVIAADTNSNLRSSVAGQAIVAPVRDFALHGVIAGVVVAFVAVTVAAVSGRRR